MGPKRRGGAAARSGRKRKEDGGASNPAKFESGDGKPSAVAPEQSPADLWWSSILPPSPILSTPYSGPSLLLLATLIAYHPSLSGTFIWDDYIFVNAPQATSWNGINDIWFRPGSIDREVHYWPVVYTSFWLEHKLYGGFDDEAAAAAKMRVTNLALHAINALIVGAIMVKRLGRSRFEGWISSMAFALHPVRVESVAWIIERKDVLSGFFFLVALWFHPNCHPSSHLDDGGAGAEGHSERRKAVLTSTCLYALGLLSKTAAVSLPVALLIVPWYHRGILRKRDVIDVLPLFVVGVLLILFDMSIDDESVVGFDYSFQRRILIGTRAVCFYLLKVMWPVDLVMMYPRWDVGGDGDDDPMWAWYSCFGLVAALLMGLGAAAHLGKLGRGPFASLLFFGAALGPSLGLVDYSYMQYSFVADRFQYLAAIGPIAVVAGLFGTSFGPGWGEKTKRASAAILCLWLATLAALTHRHSRHFVDDSTYFGHITTSNPDSPHGWYHLGDHLSKSGDKNDIAKAVRATSTAIDRYGDGSFLPEPSRSHLGGVLHSNLGIQLHKLNRNEEAIPHLEKSLMYNPKKWKSLNWLGNAHSDLGNRERAVGYFTKATTVNPESSVAWGNLGNELARMGRYDEALGPLTRSLELDPTGKNTRGNRGHSYARLGRYGEAVEDFRAFLKMSPNHKTVTGWLEEALEKMKAEK